MKVQPFVLRRHEDATGVSGCGDVAVGVVFPSGHAVMEWQTEHRSIAIYPSIDEVLAIHGHNGRTEVLLVHEIP